MGNTLKNGIGLLGGTFNPIHFGHLNLAIELKEKAELSEVWLIPAPVSPFRVEESMASIENRLNMVELAVSDIPGFRVLDIELHRPVPSYTIDTVRELVKNHRNCVLLLGEDVALGLPKWKEAEDLAKLLPFLIGARREIELKNKLDSLRFPEAIEEAIRQGIIETSLMEISSTQIRKRLENHLYCGHLIPAKVLDYIYENQLYFNPKS